MAVPDGPGLGVELDDEALPTRQQVAGGQQLGVVDGETNVPGAELLAERIHEEDPLRVGVGDQRRPVQEAVGVAQ